MAPIDMRRYDTYTREIPPVPFTQPPGFTPLQPTGSPSRDRPMALHPLIVSSDTQAFPILPGQLEKHLEHSRRRHDVPTQVTPVSGSTPSLSPGKTLVLNPPPETIPTVYAFQASTLGMPSSAEYTRFLTRYLDEMVSSRQGKALIDSKLLGRIRLILTSQHHGSIGSRETSSDSDSVHGTPYGTGGSWDTPPFRRWVRRTFVFRQATQAELERAIDFGLVSPPGSSLSGPGVPGHAPSTCLSHSMDLVFHQDRPVAVRSRIYRIILRAHWITNHAGRDRTWALVQEVCSYIPKRLVYDFVAACPACRVTKSGYYAAHTRSGRGTSAQGREMQRGPGCQGGEKGSVVERRFPHQPYDISMSTDPLRHHPEINGQIVVGYAPDLPFGSAKLSTLSSPLPLSSPGPHSSAEYSQQPGLRDHDLQDTQQEVPTTEPISLFWAGIRELVEAKRRRDEDVNMLTDSPALRRKGDLLVPQEGTAEESIESIGVDVGRETVVIIFSRAARR